MLKKTTRTFLLPLAPCCRRFPIEKVNPEIPVVSALSRMIEDSDAAADDDDGNGRENGDLALTIYLPDCNSLIVNVKESCNFKDVIQRVLITHEKQGILPPLIYNDPGMYELRIHEGKLFLRVVVLSFYSLLIFTFSFSFFFMGVEKSTQRRTYLPTLLHL